jgi:hypothetical protein
MILTGTTYATFISLVFSSIIHSVPLPIMLSNTLVIMAITELVDHSHTQSGYISLFGFITC